MKNSPKSTVFGGDLNAKTHLIGSKNSNERGNLFEDWICSNNLLVVNRGDSPTFQTGNRSSVIDFTCASSSLYPRITEWKVLTNEENLSDHRTITFNITDQPHNNSTNFTIKQNIRYSYLPSNKNTSVLRIHEEAVC